ncbi:probable serine/threonine-protein kinase At1g01540 [Mercurialis annua]|uniref:probable serine/threonine-protein kinase At1g01540 n=1 Tax=Mercurialis annua TaxID=3986 RepID=UPI00215E1BAC|nr:probable serine/threonine-protein kinase At1g01540 [Mercurialis annua]
MFNHQFSLSKILSKQTPFFGIRLWIILVALVLVFSLLILTIIFTSIICLHRKKKFKSLKSNFLISNAISCGSNFRNFYSGSSLDKRLLSQRIGETEMNLAKLDHPNKKIMSSVDDLESAGRYFPDAWRGNRFSYKDIEVVTGGFSDENLIGNGNQGVVYRGSLLDSTRVAVKSLLSKSCGAEQFITEVEMIGHVRHKNLVKLLGYCTEGGYRMLVNEYVDNGNLQQWLHGWTDEISPLTWDIRMNIIQAVAKGLAYLHEDIEPKIVHHNLKSCNILLDHHWNPKISDYGIVKLCDSQENQIAALTYGYITEECASDGVVDEKIDVYSFGILVMEIICGRIPVDHNQPQVHLIDWLKSMVAKHKIMYVADPKLAVLPSLKELKRAILVALRCVDPDLKHRPTMGDVVHMLEPRDLLLNDELRFRRNSLSNRSCSQGSLIVTKSAEADFATTHETESSSNDYQKMIFE